MIQLIAGLLVMGGAAYLFWRQTFTVVLVEKGGELVSVRRWRIRRPHVLLLVAGGVLGYGIMGWRWVPPGHVAVRSGGQVVQGVYWTAWPLEPVRTFPLRVQVIRIPGEGGEDRAVWGGTRDGVSVGLRLEVWYRLDSAHIAGVARRWANAGALQEALEGLVEGEIRNLLVTLSVRDLHTGPREALAERLRERLAQAVGVEGVRVERVVLRDVLIPVSFQKAFEQEALARARLAQEDLEVERARKAAERVRIEAEAQAQAIEIVSRALKRNPEYIRYRYVEKLSDKVEVIVQDVPGFLNFSAPRGSPSPGR